jgi:F-type H+-transporting ATPase subunit a
MVPLKAEVLTTIFGFPLTSTIITTVLADIVILAMVLFLRKKYLLVPGKFQNIVETVMESLSDLNEQVAGKGKRLDAIFPWFVSFFLFIFVSDMLALLPGYHTFIVRSGTGEHLPLLRAATSDLNVTLALALVSVAATNIMSIRFIGIKNYLLRFFSINPIYLFVGLLEIVSELTRIVSLSFRLFGNIYSGEYVLSMMLNMFAFLGPLPFLGL